MESKLLNAFIREYEDFEPSFEWVNEEVCDTLLMFLPGFRKEQLKVQVTTSRILKVSGERLLSDKKWSRFHKEFQISGNCDVNEITAKFEGGILSVKLPKTIGPAEPKDKAKPTTETSETQQRTSKEPNKPGQDINPENKKVSGSDKGKQKPEEKMNVPENRADKISDKFPEKSSVKQEESGKFQTQTREKQKKHEKHFDNTAETSGRKEGHVHGNGKAFAEEESFKQDVNGQLMTKKTKKPGKLATFVVAVMTAFVLGFYVRGFIRPCGKITE